MRRPLVLALPLLTLFALPAAADSGKMHVFRGVHAQHGDGFHRFLHLNTFHRFGNGAFLAPFAWDWGGAPYAAGAAGTVIVLNMAPPAPSAPPAAPVPAIQTEHGVTVIRGPGTHHH